MKLDANFIDVKIGARLFDERTRQNIGIEIFAKKIGISIDELLEYEDGVKRMHPRLLSAICNGLNISLDQLFQPIMANRSMSTPDIVRKIPALSA